VVESVYSAVQTDSSYKADYVSSFKGYTCSVLQGGLGKSRIAISLLTCDRAQNYFAFKLEWCHSLLPCLLQTQSTEPSLHVQPLCVSTSNHLLFFYVSKFSGSHLYYTCPSFRVGVGHLAKYLVETLSPNYTSYHHHVYHIYIPMTCTNI